MADAPAWAVRTRRLSLHRPLVMGIVNVTPDSFSDGGRHADVDAAVAHGLELAAAGADIVDVGGESTRPGAEGLDAEREIGRVVPVVERLAAAGLVVSIDTAKPEVAAAAVDAGVEIINDVTAAGAVGMSAVMASSGAGVVLMHMQGTPATMQAEPRYHDVVAEVTAFLVTRAEAVRAAGVARDRIAIDPGIGFGKTVGHNLELLRSLGTLVATGYPVMVGASRKAFLGAIVHADVPADRDMATAAVTALAVDRGCAIVRVHDVVSSDHAAKVASALGRGDRRGTDPSCS